MKKVKNYIAKDSIYGVENPIPSEIYKKKGGWWGLTKGEGGSRAREEEEREKKRWIREQLPWLFFNKINWSKMIGQNHFNRKERYSF